MSADMVLALAGVAMLVLALLMSGAGGAVIAARLGAAHAAALAVAALAQATARGQPVLLALAGLALVKAVALPWLLPGDAREPGRPLPALAIGAALAVLAWMALPPVAGLRPMAAPSALAMLALGILPSALGQGAARRFLGLLVAADGAMLAALDAADPAQALLLELGVMVLLGAFLVAMRWGRDAPRAISMTWSGTNPWATIPWTALPVLVPLGTALLVLVVRFRAMGVWIGLAGAVVTLVASLVMAWLHPADRLAALAASLAGCVGVAIALAMPAWIAREIDGFRLAAPHVPRLLATGHGLLAGVMLAVVAPGPVAGWLGLVAMTLALLLPLALAGEPAVRVRGRAMLNVAAIGLVVALLGVVALAAPGVVALAARDVVALAARDVVALAAPGGAWRPAAARADGALAWLGAACLLLGAGTGGALAALAGRENATPARGLSGFAVILALVVLALRLPAPALVAGLGVLMVLGGAIWAARAGVTADWVDGTALAQAGMALVAAGLGTPAGRFAALAQLGLLVLTRIAVPAGAVGLLALAGLPPFGLFAGIFLVLSAVAAVSVPFAAALAVALLVPVWRLRRLMPPMARPAWRDLPGWAVLALGGALGLAMPQNFASWIGRVVAEWP